MRTNLIEAFNEGQADRIGIPFGEGLERLSLAMNGTQGARIYGVAGPQKSGKSTFADYAFVLTPYLVSINNPKLTIRWIYYSFEIDRISKEFDFAAFFLNMDHNINKIILPEGVTRDGKNYIEISPDYLKGNLMDDNFKPIKINPEVKSALINVYENRIVPLFGEFDAEGIQIRQGLIDFRTHRENPTGVYKDLKAQAETEGRVIKDANDNWLSYIPNNPNLLTIVVLDHMRKLKPERNWQMKQTIDKMSEYMVILRNLLGYTFIPILHTNRNLTSGEKVKMAGQDIYPTADDLKDSGWKN